MAIFNIEGKNFVITGGASGLGAGYVLKFLEQGAKNIAILDIAETEGKALVQKLDKIYPRKLTFFKCDMSKEEEILKTFETVISKLKLVDVIINNAGVMVDAPNKWRIASDINWQGVVSLTMKGIKHMSKKENGLGGTIVNISSVAALSKFQFLPIYSGSKMAVLHFSQSIAVDPFYETTGIRILCICFGPTDTPLLANLDSRSYEIDMGKILAESVIESNVSYQKPASAIASVDYMIKHGENGSTWLSIDDKPAKDITNVIDKAFDLFDQEMNK